MADKAVLHYPGGELDLPQVPATDGNDGLNVSDLLKVTDRVALDNGFVNTAACESAITYIDGDVGILRYRGYPIEQLAASSTYLEVAYLLIYGDLPSESGLADFVERINRHTLLHEDLRRLFDGFPRNAHPMPVLSSAVSALSTFYEDSLDPLDPEQVEISTIRLLAKLPTIAAYAYKKSVGQPYIFPNNSFDYVSNFLRMTFGVPAEEYEVDPVVVQALDMLLILHADHEQNCSTTAMRTVGSSHADPYISTAAAASALYGPRHGGANEAVIRMLNRIGSTDNVPAYVEGVKRGEQRLQGFGHRVYKNYDPRAKIIKRTADAVFEVTGKNPLLDIALALEDVALSDDYFISRKLYPNVDFYSGLIYQAMGFPMDMFTVLFAIPRVSGWLSHYIELLDQDSRIYRPRQVYTGVAERDYVPITDR
jgi:citrate synthase